MMKRRGTLFGLVAAAAACLSAAAAAHPAGAPTLATTAHTIGFGTTITLRGAVPGARAGEDVQILAHACGFSGPIPTGQVKTTAGGRYSYTVQPMLNSTFFVTARGTTSEGVAVHVQPSVQLRRVNARTFAVDVSADNGTWFTKAVTLQRLDTHTGTWKPVASAALAANSDPDALISVSSATIHATVKRGAQVRAVVTQATVGACYLPAASAPLQA